MTSINYWLCVHVLFCLLSFAFVAARSQRTRDAAGRLADEHALIATYVSRLQSGARLVLGAGTGAVALLPPGRGVAGEGIWPPVANRGKGIDTV